VAGWVYHLRKCGYYQSKIKIKCNYKGKSGKRNRIQPHKLGEAADGYLLSIRNSLSSRKRFENIINKAKSIAKKNKKDIIGCIPSDQNGNEHGLLKGDFDSND
jgi:fructose-specific phosphotransferase system component IIB